MKTAIITDSTAYLSNEYIEQHDDLYVISLSVILNQSSYKESHEITTNEFYAKLKQVEELPMTSQPSIGEYIDLLEQLKNKGYEKAIAIHLSSGISGTYQNSITAGKSVDGIDVYSFDSKLACMIEGFYVDFAYKHKNQRTADEIIDEMTKMRDQTTEGYIVVDDLSNLRKGGRLTATQAMIGTMLHIKPVLTFEDGLIVPNAKIRTLNKALKQIEHYFEDIVHQYPDEQIHATIIHANNEDAAEKWLYKMKEKYPNINITLSHFGPVIGTHLGSGALAMGWVIGDF